MNQKELTCLNLGTTLDHLANLDPRGYGVCNILYPAARKAMGEPLSMHAAKALVEKIKENDLVYIITGFILPTHKVAEMDGIVSSMLLARALVKAFHAKPIIICPIENKIAVEKLSFVCGLHLYETVEEVMEYPISMGVIPFTKNILNAQSQSNEILEHGLPAMAISIEAPGANAYGVYHNAIGMNVSELEAKSDVLYQTLQKLHVPTIAIGDLGNEIGMGTIKEHVEAYIPYAQKSACKCSCQGGIVAATKADYLITATVSDWGCYAMIAALAYLKRNKDIMQNEELEKEAVITASRCGMVDMTGWLIPAIDGMGMRMNLSIVNLMRDCMKYSMELEETCITWFEEVEKLGFFEKVSYGEGRIL